VVSTATEEFLSPQEVGDRIGVSVYTVRRWIHEGRLQALKPGKEYRVRESDLEEFLRAREVRPKAPRRSPSEPSLFNGLEEERRVPPLRRLISLTNRLADRWEEEIAKREREWQAAKPTVRKHVKRLPNLNWANEIRKTVADVVAEASEELEVALGVATSAEALELFSALRRLDKLIDRTAPWFDTDAEDAPGMAQVYDIRERLGRVEKRLGSQAS
jgi:excisionase family DNA binding protein